MCARKLPTRRHIPAHGALLDDLLVVAGIAPLLQADLRTQPRYDLFATDASPSGAGACIAKVTPDLWHSLYRIAEERGEHVRLDWGPAPPPPSFVSTHSSAAALVTPAAWTELFAYRFRANDHINVLELVALVSLLRRLSNQGVRRQRILCCVDSESRLRRSDQGQVFLPETQPRFAQTCLRVPCFLAHRRPALGTVVGKPGRCTVAACLSGPLAP